MSPSQKERMEELNKEMRGKARLIRTVLTKLEKDINLKDKDNDTIALRVKKCETLHKELDELMCSMLAISEEDEVDSSCDVDDRFIPIISKAKRYLGQPIYAGASTALSTSSTPTNVESASSACIKSAPELRLPPINVPTFNGSYEQWLTFHDTFKGLVHDNSRLEDIQKFYYLRDALKGPAENVIRCFAITNQNYELAWSALIDRYERKRKIIYAHVKSIVEINALQKESHTLLRNLLDNVIQNVNVLKSMKRDIISSDDLIVYLITNKLDSRTRRAWEATLNPQDIPSLEQLLSFIKKQCDSLEDTSLANATNIQPTIRNVTRQANVAITAQTRTNQCFICGMNGHWSNQCFNLLNLQICDRIKLIKSKKLCENCFHPSHNTINCVVRTCKKCQQKHHTLLHDDSTTSHAKNAMSSTSTSAAAHVVRGNRAILPVCLIDIADRNGKKHTVRAFLDSGAEINFMTTDLMRKLKLTKCKVNEMAAGIGNTPAVIAKYTTCSDIYSRHSDYNTTLQFKVIDEITSETPSVSYNFNASRLPEHMRLKLADPNFNIPNKIDILLDADVWFSILGHHQYTIDDLKFQSTKLGLIVGGKIANGNPPKINLASSATVDYLLKRFWEIEEMQSNDVPEDDLEKHFLSTTTRNKYGRFIVKIPWKCNPSSIGNSLANATKRFLALERRLLNDSGLREQYCQFLLDYLSQGHMEMLKGDDGKGYYMPHHAVFKQEGVAKKIRVVFDASAKSANGLAINDLQMVGPNLQNDLISILLRFRQHKYVMTADLKQMYRQISVHEDDVQYQKILWRFAPTDPLQTYALKTVTYGTASASYLATRCLKEIGNNVSDDRLAYILKNDFYMDDMLTGCNNIHELNALKQRLISTLDKYSFTIHKWLSNINATSNERKDICNEPASKILGLHWNPMGDDIIYQPTAFDCKVWTRRNVVSHVARLFDPLGLLGPIIVLGKLIMQQTCNEKIAWDQPLSGRLLDKWMEFKNALNTMNEIRVGRRTCYDHNNFEIFGFSDASQDAYGAAIYIRSKNDDGSYVIKLLCAKSRVAPTKTVCLPRLELCAMLLLSELSHKVQNALKKDCKCYLFSDSEIALTWIRSSANRWKTFVANRVARIQELTSNAEWYHVSGKDNPADLISRGVLPNKLQESRLWWNGPEWLSKEISLKQEVKFNCVVEAPEQRILHTRTLSNDLLIACVHKFSDYNKMLRVTAYIRRFMHNMRNGDRRKGDLTPDEINAAEEDLIKRIQHQYFYEEICCLSKSRPLHSKSQILCLNPFLDANGLLRVGGRLEKSSLDYAVKHPILMPSHGHITEVMIRSEHIKILHAGLQATLYSLRQRYWLIGGRNCVRKVLRKCLKCFKANPKAIEPMMGNLPSCRTEVCRPFLHTGVDYCGPFLIKYGTRLTKKLVKSYVAIFICMATKAIHIEVVGNLTSEAFIAALRRFTSRRGNVAHLYSDNGTTFVGADKELQRTLTKIFNENRVKDELLKYKIIWHFIPPRAPHFGGLWEAAVKSAKKLLKRVANDSLTYEEFNTLLVQIEGILNSRPLTPLSSDPNDLNVLSPSHFLIGDLLINLPENNVMEIPTNRLTIWERIQHIKQNFWKRWSREYLNELQRRTKWTQTTNPLQVGKLIIMKEDNMIPGDWTIGRILEVHPGDDGIVRTATIRCANGTFQRPATKLCPLPDEQSD